MKVLGLGAWAGKRARVFVSDWARVGIWMGVFFEHSEDRVVKGARTGVFFLGGTKAMYVWFCFCMLFLLVSWVLSGHLGFFLTKVGSGGLGMTLALSIYLLTLFFFCFFIYFLEN